MYLNSEPISLVVRLMVIPWKDATLMVLRPLQKLCGDSSVMSTIAQLVSSIIHGSNSLSFSYQIILKKKDKIRNYRTYKRCKLVWIENNEMIHIPNKFVIQNEKKKKRRKKKQINARVLNKIYRVWLISSTFFFLYK